MRTLQRHRQMRPPENVDVSEATQEMGPRVQVHERQVWKNRFRFLFLTVVLPGLLILTAHWFWNLRLVADGVVMNRTIGLCAPADVRVVDVYCQDGQVTRRGDPLLRLESRLGQKERRALEYRVEEARLRLSLAREGGALQDLSITQRADRIAEADNELARAEGEYRVAVADLNHMLKDRDALIVDLQKAAALRQDEMSTLLARIQEAEARAEAAEADARLTTFELDSATQLHAQELLSERDFAEVEARYLSAHQQWRAADAAVRTLRRQQTELKTADEFEAQLDPLSMQEMDARIEAQQARVRAILDRRDLWKQVGERRRSLLDEESLPALQELELQLLQTQLREAEARLEALDATIGNLIVRAEADGIIDRVLVSPGNVLQADDALLTYYDPSTQWCTAYLPPADAERVTVGQECTIVLEGVRDQIPGRVTSVGRTWVDTPPTLHSEGDHDLRVPVRIDAMEPGDRDLLLPNARIRVLFSSRQAGSEEPR